MDQATLSTVWAVALFLAALSFSTATASQYSGHKVVSIQVSNEKQHAQVEDLGLTMWSCTPVDGRIDVQVPPDRMADLVATGLPFEIFIDDIEELVAAQFSTARGGTFHDAYHTIAELESEIQLYETSYPALAEVVSFGSSLLSQDLVGLRITSSVGGPEKPAILIHGGQHAREWVGPAVMMWMADWLLTNYGTDARATRMLDELEFYILPVMNPDGYDYTWTTNRMWRKNRRPNAGGTFGVDLNRNWGYGWGVSSGSSPDPSSEIYRGPSAFSEPETQSIRDFVLNHPNILGYIDFHSYSQLIMWPWGWSASLCPDHVEFNHTGTNMAHRLREVHNMVYRTGPIYSTIYPASGVSCDWVYGQNIDDRFIEAFAWELRDRGQTGFLLPPEQIVPTAQENLEAVLFLAHTVAEPLRIEWLSPVPGLIFPGETMIVDARVTPRREQLVAGSVELVVNNDEGEQVYPMASMGGDDYRVQFTASGCGGSLMLHVRATGDGGGTGRFPAFAPSETIDISLGVPVISYSDSLEAASAWLTSVPSDTATVGTRWTRVDPIGTSAQTENDATPFGTMCFVTGQGVVGGAAGASDIDNGPTTLETPTFVHPGPGWLISFTYWYTNNLGTYPDADQMNLFVSNNAGATWTLIDVLNESSTSWMPYTLDVAAEGIAATNQMRLRFVASDSGGDSIVEAAIDDLMVFQLQCATPNGDGDRDGVVTLADYSMLDDCLTGPAVPNVTQACAMFNFDLDFDVDMDDYQAFASVIGP